RLQASAWSKIRFFCSAVNFRRWRRSFSSRGTTSLVLDLGLGTVGLSSPPGLVHLSSGGECLSCYWHRGLLESLESKMFASATPYYRKHERFRQLPEQTTYGDAIHHFLKLRNVVAAHANSSPP